MGGQCRSEMHLGKGIKYIFVVDQGVLILGEVSQRRLEKVVI